MATFADVVLSPPRPCVELDVSVECAHGHRHRREFLMAVSAWEDLQQRMLTVDSYKQDIVRAANNCKPPT